MSWFLRKVFLPRGEIRLKDPERMITQSADKGRARYQLSGQLLLLDKIESDFRRTGNHGSARARLSQWIVRTKELLSDFSSTFCLRAREAPEQITAQELLEEMASCRRTLAKFRC